MNDATLTSLFDLTGKTALVTGAGSGIGRATTVLLARAGATVVAVDVSSGGLAETVSAAATLSVEPIELDISDFDATQRALGGKKFDAVVNVAGIMARGVTLDAATKEDWERVTAVNQTGAFHILKTTVPAMTRPGSIVLLASMMAQSGSAVPAYTATKGAMLALARQLAAELGPEGIRVNTVSPGMIETPMTSYQLSLSGFGERTVERTPMRRLGQPDDIANAVLYLVSDQSSFVTGTDVLVDGGLSSALYL